MFPSELLLFYFFASSSLKDTCFELSRHTGRQACQRSDGKQGEKMEISLTVSHLHKCIIRLSDHVHTQRLEMLVRLAVEISWLPLTVASIRLRKCQDAMNDSTFATMTIFLTSVCGICLKVQRLSSAMSQYCILTFVRQPWMSFVC